MSVQLHGMVSTVRKILTEHPNSSVDFSKEIPPLFQGNSPSTDIDCPIAHIKYEQSANGETSVSQSVAPPRSAKRKSRRARPDGSHRCYSAADAAVFTL